MQSSPPYIVILTGGIASGKSTVADAFKELKIEVIDADRISHDIVKPGEAGAKRIQQVFGDYFFVEDGSLDRAKMRDLVFSDPLQRIKLESLLHPLIRQEIQHQIERTESDYVILDIPLYAENKAENKAHYVADRVLVVDVPESLQLSRLMQRDSLSENQAMQILKAQSSRAKRLELADDIIDNSGTMEQLSEAVKKLHNHYLRKSHRQSGT